MIPRWVRQDVVEALDSQPAVALVGPRQVGKTTLAVEIAEQRGGLYLDLENPLDLAKLSEPVGFLGAHRDRLVVIDEIHRAPELFPVLRGIIDAGRREGKGTGRFLVLGSAALDLMRQSETLAGRIRYVPMGPLTLPETGPPDRLWLRGGFPNSMLAPDDRESLRWRQDFIQTYLERDIPLFGPRIPAETLRRFWTMLAHRQGSLLNASDLARALEVSAQTVTRYLDLLCDLLLVRRVPPFVGNVGKRLVKSPRVYVRDSGLVHALLGLESLDDVLSHPVVGASWEGFVLENLLTFLPWRTEPSHYRSSGGAEIDLVLSFASGALWAIEVKRSPAAKPQRGFHEACEAIGVQRRILVRSGEGRFPLGNGVESVGLADLCDELRRHA